MKKTMEIIDVNEEQPVVNSTELKEVKKQIQSLLTVIKIIMGVAIICIALFILGGVGIAVDYAITSNPEAGEEIYVAIQCLIVSAVILYITVVCKGFCESIIKSGTPFIPQVSKGLRKISIALYAVVAVSIASDAVYSLITHTEFDTVIDMTLVVTALILTLLSSIFDYGCKLQKESDETL